MVNIASTILAGFQDDLVVLFGETLGWIVGHSILAAALATIVLGIKERDHIIQRSGFGKNEILDLGVFLLLTLSLFYIHEHIQLRISCLIGSRSHLFPVNQMDGHRIGLASSSPVEKE